MIGSLGASVLLVASTQVDYTDDVEVRTWALSKGRLLITGDHDFCDNQELHPIEECHGILVLNTNDNPKALQAMVQMVTTLFADLHQHVSWDWWAGTKIKVRSQSCRVWKLVDGVVQSFELRPDHRGNLHFKEL